jgi:tetratricopeptide (TPR) repeat protein
MCMRSRYLVAIVLTTMLGVLDVGAQQTATPKEDALAPYQRALKQSKESEDAGDVSGALAQVTTLLRVGGEHVPPTVRADAVEQLVSLESKLHPPENWIRWFARHFTALVASWEAWLGAAIVASVWWSRHRHRSPHGDSTAAYFEDLTQPPDKRVEANVVLTRTLLNQLQNPVPVGIWTLQMDTMPGSNEPGFGGLQSALDTNPIEGFKLADRPMKVAGIEFSLQDAWTLVSRAFARPHAVNLIGWLSESSDRVDAYAELTDRLNAGQNRTWRVHAVGKGARESAIADLSAQILVGTGKSTVTHDAKSLRSFHEAIKLRQGIQPCSKDLALARNYLEEAVIYDPSNWIARFNLALTLCRTGSPQVALKHFDLLEDVIHRAWRSHERPEEPCSNAPAFRDVRDHLKKYPECLFLILYNKAMAQAATQDVNLRPEALSQLKQIGKLRDMDGAETLPEPYNRIASKLSERARCELSLYGLGAQAMVLASPSYRRCDEPVPASEASCVEALLKEIDGLCNKMQERHWRAIQTARAVALSASARLVAIQGNVRLACERLNEAIAAEPRLVEGYLLLAELQIRFETQCAHDWRSRAELLLKRVLELNSECTHAMSLLTRLSTPTPTQSTASYAISMREPA